MSKHCLHYLLLGSGRKRESDPERVLKRSLCARYTNRRLLLTTETLTADLIERLLIVWGKRFRNPPGCSPQPLYNRQRKQLKKNQGWPEPAWKSAPNKGPAGGAVLSPQYVTMSSPAARFFFEAPFVKKPGKGDFEVPNVTPPRTSEDGF